MAILPHRRKQVQGTADVAWEVAVEVASAEAWRVAIRDSSQAELDSAWTATCDAEAKLALAASVLGTGSKGASRQTLV